MKFLLVLFSSIASGQVHLTFVQQGAEVLRAVAGQVPPGLGIVEAIACVDGDARVLTAGRIYQAAASLKISVVSPDLAAPILDRQKARNKWQIGLDIGAAVSSTAGALGTTKILKMPNGAAATLSLLPLGVELGKGFFTKRLPNDTPVRSGLLKDPVGIPAKDCASRLLLARYHEDWDPREITIP